MVNEDEMSGYHPDLTVFYFYRSVSLSNIK